MMKCILAKVNLFIICSLHSGTIVKDRLQLNMSSSTYKKVNNWDYLKWHFTFFLFKAYSASINNNVYNN